MAEKLLMLALSPTMETGVIAKWLKKEGDAVASGDLLCEVETDKATMDYESPASGTLLKIVLDEGSSAAVGDLIGVIGKAGEDIQALLAEPEKPAKQESPKPAQDESPAEEKPDVPAPQATGEGGRVRSSPLARKLAEMNGIKLETVQGSGPEGRVVKADIEKALAGGQAAAPAAQAAAPAPVAGDTVIPVSGKRKVIARRLSESKYSAPHYYLKVRVAMDTILDARGKLNAKASQKVSLNAYLIKFAAEALKRHPAVNASWAGDSIIRFGRVDIGLAVAQEDGLITPVVRDCANKGLLEIEKDLQELIQKARTNTLKPEEYSDATFTISSLGSFGIEEFTAIINPPGSAILAVGEIRKEPVVQPDDSIQVKQMMRLTLSCDHRVIDGAVGAAFLTDLRTLLEEPIRALY
ncbi:MAG: 2-oxo acid dehydrogenase subunit E2 [Clostridiaceae bacterium]|jgi:pyruvate dehydrogenase E2 component (dihydrolipoamide acetyltransferase)|nr:2-oxo acid dehydrogenase subunit E2 [Clostridiaceae bacterium]